METWIAAIQKVELVGGESWWSKNGGSLVIACAAIGAAGLAAYMAVRNLREQLAHDRELRNREHIRDIIDEAASRASELRTSVDKLLATARVIERLRDEALESGEDPAPELVKSWSELLEPEEEECVKSLYPAREAAARLELRLASDHPVVTSYRRLHRSLHTYLTKGHAQAGETRPQEVRDRDRSRQKEVNKAYENFRRACRAWLNEQPNEELTETTP